MTTDQPERPAATRRSYTPFIVLGVILVIGVAVALIASSGGDDASDVGTADGRTDAGGDDELVDLATAGVTVVGEPLDPIPESGDDPAVGSPAPTLEGVDSTGRATTVTYGDGPTLLAFLAHWCPHCQAEVPEIVELAGEGVLEGIDTVAVLTGTDETAPNFPPGPWLEREGWTGRVLLDDEGNPAADAFGLTSYPYLVLVDEEGNVIDRNAGALGREGLRDFISQAG